MSIATVGVFVLLLAHALFIARGLLLPIVLALLLKFLLVPVVRLLRRLHLPDLVSAGIVVAVLVGLLALGTWRLIEPAERWMQQAPQTLERIEATLRDIRAPVEQIGEAGDRVERLARGESTPAPHEVTARRTPLSEALLSTTTEFGGALVVVLILLFFLLASGQTFLRKLVILAPTMDAKKAAVHLVHDLERDLSRYLFTVTLINSGLGIAIGLTMAALDVPNPVLWGVMAALFNYVPYLGAIVGACVVTLVAAAAGTGGVALLMVPLLYLTLTTTEGQLLTPLILGKRLMLNPVAIFIGVIFWAWLWGVPGALLAVPILVSLKIVCAHVPALKPAGEFLGR